MRAVKLRAGKPAELTDVKNTLKALQAEVDGPIEVIPIPDAQGSVLIVNEEGKLRGDLEYNRPIRDAAKNSTIDMIFGDALILGTDGETCAVVLGALREQPDQTQLRELIEENGRLKRELDAARNEKNAITITANKRIDEISHLRRELEAANEREAKMMVRIAELTPEPVEDAPDPDEDDEPEPVEAKPEKKKRAYHGSHRWTQTEDEWIAAHLNSATNVQVAEKFGVTPKAAYLRMTIVRERLGK